MKDIWIISDTHFSHANICKFLRDDGSSLRPWDNVDEMDEALIENWNSVIKPQDKVYHLGDFSMDWKTLPEFTEKLHGHKRLIRGNHDMCPTAEYMKYFEDIYGVRVFHEEKMIFSHYPIHEVSIAHKDPKWLNVHGHLHYHKMKEPFYFNASVECINYTPIHFDELREIQNKL